MPDTAVSRLIGALLVCVLGLAVSACGDDDEDSQSASSSREAKRVSAVERAFLATMVPHHQSAIAMAKVAREKGNDPFVIKLADGILATQQHEIARMQAIHERLLGRTLKPDPDGHEELGLTAAEAGMTHDPQATRALRAAEPFDRAFVDEMVPHHEGAIRMANVVLKRARDGELRRLARDIVSTQQQEIEQMNSFRTRRFGGPVPAGAGHEDHPTDGNERKENEEHGAGHSR